MPSKDAERQRLKREREALELVECRPCWPNRRAFETFANVGLMSDEEADDSEARGRFAALVVEAVAEKLSRGDTLTAAIGIFSGPDIRRLD